MTVPVGNNNHIGLVYRPGEAPLVAKLLDLLGCQPSLPKLPFAGVYALRSKDEAIFISEVTPEQWEFELWLQERLEKIGSDRAEAFLNQQRLVPQRGTHFGIGSATLQDWEDRIAKLADAAARDPDLSGRISMSGVFRPGEEGSVAKESNGLLGATLYQAFIRTDLFSAGLLTLGQTIELQHYLENDPAYTGPRKVLETYLSLG
jgi:hypothetical protein